MTDSIVVKRLVRNLQYRQTYIKVFEAFLEPDLHPVVVRLLSSLVETQQTAVVTLSSYLRGLSVDTQDLPLYQKLMDQAAQRQGVSSRLRFIRHGLRKAVSWYQMQLTDKQMTADPGLRQILSEMGEIEAAKLWSVETVMAMLRIPLQPDPEDRRELQRFNPQRLQGWRPGLVEAVERPAWKGGQSTMLPRPSRSGHSD